MDLPEITRYHIIRQLGAGGMGEVFLAEDTRLERRVAIKMLPDKLAGDSHSRWRLIHARYRSDPAAEAVAIPAFGD